ncbi:hypothetical protein C9374_009162 [Naegleria lovaniensis]|uniref:T4 RNA ligase 1-like N-terminal domain-containing protein n=1 Tax=Naegleria lovaniensis TaxID=51637 RepID=A0AA88GJJ6_NAELO|nr:uncharacterized protein C9374_009162 [Naegleria lovaniensis]KAG2377646.1 hypothetical protein C9374_009162 [Naegleria lovaniensis]
MIVDYSNSELVSSSETNKQSSLFPSITHLSQVVEAIGTDTDDFKFMEQDEYLFYCYGRVKSTTFPPLIESSHSSMISDEELQRRKIRREIRGLTFEKSSGKLVSRCLHKFFNLDENEESSIQTLESRFNTHSKSINLLDIFLVLEKLDGSMVMPIYVNNNIVFRTKRGYFNNVTNEADLFVKAQRESRNSNTHNEKNSIQYLEFCEYTMNQGLTPIFEFYSKQNMVVVEYSETFLTLIAIRSTCHGSYMPYEEMCELCEKFNIPYVKCIFNGGHLHSTILNTQPSNTSTIIIHTFEELKTKVNELHGIEGVVLRHKQSGEMYKLKTHWYSELHKKKQLITDSNPSPSHVWKLVLDDSVDDFLPFLNTEKEKQELRRFNDEVWNAIDECAESAMKVVQEAMNSHHAHTKLILNSTQDTHSNVPSTVSLQLPSAKAISQYIFDHTSHNIIFRKIVYKVKGELDKKKLQEQQQRPSQGSLSKGTIAIMTPQEVVKYYLLQYIFKDLDLVKNCLNRPHLVYNNYRMI